MTSSSKQTYIYIYIYIYQKNSPDSKVVLSKKLVSGIWSLIFVRYDLVWVRDDMISNIEYLTHIYIYAYIYI